MRVTVGFGKDNRLTDEEVLHRQYASVLPSTGYVDYARSDECCQTLPEDNAKAASEVLVFSQQTRTE